METSKLQTILDYLKKTYDEYDIDSRENPETLSCDFSIDTGTARIILEIRRKLWDNCNNVSIVSYFESQESMIRKALLDNQDVTLPMG